MSAYHHPCVRRCCLDSHDICLGCFRSLEEIKAWTNMSATQQERVMQIARERQNAHVKRYGHTF